MHCPAKARAADRRPAAVGCPSQLQTEKSTHSYFRWLLPIWPAGGLIIGFVAALFDHGDLTGWIWAASTIPVLAVLVVEIVAALRMGKVGLDIVAALSMSAALIFGEELAAAVVALMYAGGQLLEAYADRRARREMTALLGRVPRTCLRKQGGELQEVAIDAIVPGDRLLIRQGDIVPVDGTVASGVAVLDESPLTGESLPVNRRTGERAMSGSANTGDAFDLTATRPAAESTFAGIVRLVRQAQQSRAPMVRLADRFALGFLPLTLAIAALAWIVSGDPIRSVAVLVVATPCPLILAVPIAIVSGLSRAARVGILIKGGKALELLSRIRVIVIDKTGTLTEGHARILAEESFGEASAAEVRRLAASLEQASKHTIAATIVAETRRGGVALVTPSAASEEPGEGIVGVVEGHQVIVGSRRFVAARLPCLGNIAADAPGAVEVLVGVDGKLAGRLVLADHLRPEAVDLLHDLRDRGVERIVLATGDRREVADAISADLWLDAVRSELTPDQKVMVVLSERKHGPVMMVGDGINDAPALAAADLGVAMGARGTAASAEASDVVLLVDRIDRLRPAIDIARRSSFIALESVVAGIGLSLAGMVAAAYGLIIPVEGAILQEFIDVAVILNALRALR